MGYSCIIPRAKTFTLPRRSKSSNALPPCNIFVTRVLSSDAPQLFHLNTHKPAGRQQLSHDLSILGLWCPRFMMHESGPMFGFCAGLAITHSSTRPRQQFTPRRIRDDDRVRLHRTHRPRRGRTSTYEPAASVVAHVDSRERDRRPLFAWFRCDRRSSGERV